jgi:phage terminase large subunit-like protein
LTDACTQYARYVLEGLVVQGPHVRAACQRHLDDLARSTKPKWPYRFDLDKAQHALNFFPDLLVIEFDGKKAPFQLLDFAAFIVASLFGWVNKKTGYRRFKRAYIEAGKGSGKSPLLGGIGLYMLMADGEIKAEVYSAGAKRDQAMILFKDAVDMADASPAISRNVKRRGRNPVLQLTHPPSASIFKPLSADKSKSGQRVSCALVDELHEHKDRYTVDMLKAGFKGRQQPMMVIATNSGFDRNSICWEWHEHSVAVCAGTREDEELFAFVMALDDDDEPFELTDLVEIDYVQNGKKVHDRVPRCWIKTNPGIGITVTADYLRGQVREARDIPGREAGIRRLNFCQWTESDKAWMARASFEPCIADFDPLKEHRGKQIWLGLDLSQNRDITALGCVVKTGAIELDALRDGKIQRVTKPTFDAWIEAWTPGDTVDQRELQDKQPYRAWVNQGYLHAPQGQSIRFDHVAQAVAEYSHAFDIAQLAYDRYAFRRGFEPECEQLGLALPYVEHPQGGVKKGKPSEAAVEAAKIAHAEAEGLWMPGSVRELEDAILERRIRLQRNPVLISAIMSAVTDSDRWGNTWLAKERAVNKIDAAIALCMALGAAVQAPKHERQYQVFFV